MIPLRRTLVMLLCIFAIGTPSHALGAEDLLIVLSSQANPYIMAAAQCEDQLEKAGIKSKTVELKDLSDETISQHKYPIIAIGAKAASKLAGGLPAQTMLYYTMTPSPDKIGLTTRPHTSGVSTDIGLDEQIKIIESSPIKIRRIGMLYRSSSASSSAMIESVRSSIPANWELINIDLDLVKSDSDGIKELFKKDVDLIWTLPDPSVYNSSTIKSLLLESLRQRVPVFGFSLPLVRAGAAFGIGISPQDQGAQVATLMVDRSTETHLHPNLLVAVNLIVGERIKLVFPDSFVRSADVVFRPE